MANVKITQLPLATTPLTGTEDIPLVQGTTTKQVTVTGLFTSPVMTNPTLGTVGQANLINATGLPISTGVAGLGTGIATFLGTPSSTNLRAAVTDETGTGSLVFATSPTLVTPNLGTPSVLVATNATGTAVGLTAGSAITNANLTGAVTSVGNATSLGSFTSAQLRTALTDETGSGVNVFATSPTITSPILNQINDTNNAQILGLSPTTSAVDYLVVKNGIGVGVPLHFYADGASANIGLHIQPKGTGLVTISDGTDFNKGIRFRSSSSAASAITLLDAVSTAGRVVTLPDATTTLVGRDTTDTLTNKTIAFGSNTFSGSLAIANGGTGQATANAAFNALAPSQTGNSGKYLTTDGTDTSWASNPLGTVTSVAASVPSFLSIAGSPITTSGTLAFSLSGTALPTTSGGTGLTSFTSGGVVYASSSSALATGSALTFDGSLLNVTSFGGLRSTVTGGAYYTSYSIDGVYANGTDLYLYAPTGKSVLFYSNNAEAMRLTSSSLYTASGINVGFGTSSPSAKLHVLGSSNHTIFAGTSATTNTEYRYNTSTVAGFIGNGSSLLSGAADSDFIIRSEAAIKLAVGNSLKATLNSSGNLGLGVTPTAWNSGFTGVLEVKNAGSALASGGVGNTSLWANSYYSTSSLLTYAANGFASNYTQDSGQHIWSTAPNNTSGAGATFTFTQAMTLTAEGNLGLGTTSPVNASNQKSLTIDATTISRIDLRSGGVARFNLQGNSTETSFVNDGLTPFVYYINGTERARIDSSGNLTVPAKIFTGQINGDGTNDFALLSNNASKDIVFYTGVGGVSAVEKARITSAGNLLVGTTTSSSRLSVNAEMSLLTDGNNRAILGWDNTLKRLSFGTINASTTYFDSMSLKDGNLLVGKTSSGTTNIGVESRADGTFIATKSGSTSATETMVVYSTGAGALRFYVSMDGTVNATSIVISAISDQRLKENVRDIDTGLNAIMSLQPRRFDWKDGKGQDKKNVAGFIAQEFETVFPECVGVSKAGADGIEYKNINHETLIPTLVKAMQEQQAMIESLRQRLSAANL
jgi:hypothetical protein